MTSNLMDRITLDSNVWRDHYFISFLQSKKSPHVAHICPIIVYIETRIWYDMKGLTLSDFKADLKSLKTKVVDLSIKHVEFIVDFTMESKLSFKHHARDFMIGSIAHSENSLLITNNRKHFNWLPLARVMTPQQYLNLLLY